MNYYRWFSPQRLVTAFVVELLQERIVATLLCQQILLGRHCILQSAMHALMTSVLGRPAWLDSLWFDAQLDPPLRQLADTTQNQRGERGSVVGADHLRQPKLPKDPLKPGLHLPERRSCQRPT